jgi:hypothetical protein
VARLALLDDNPASPDAPVTAAHDGSGEPQRRLYERAARARDWLASVRPALARLRGVLPRPHGEGTPRDHDLIALAAADVARGLVQARRSVRTLAAELADLEAESRDLLAIAAAIEAGRR